MLVTAHILVTVHTQLLQRTPVTQLSRSEGIKNTEKTYRLHIQVLQRTPKGHYQMLVTVKGENNTADEVIRRTLGAWFVEAAVTGALISVPVVNVKAVSLSRSKLP
jgi:hypothetical protein